MGSASSSQGRGGEDDDDEEDEDEEEEEAEQSANSKIRKEKVLEQEPEILPCHAPTTPISAATTPRVLGPSIRVWDPCNVLIPPPPPQPPPSASDAGDPPLEVLLISHGESGAGLCPDLVGGRWPAAGLTGNGERQARALAVFLNSQGVRFGAVYSSPLDRARATAAFVCRELDFAAEQIQSCDALVEMSQGQWEGCHRSEIYTPEMISLIDRTQPDFSPPSGESLRQVQFRMMEFLYRTVLRIPEKLFAGESSYHRNDTRGFSRSSSMNSHQDQDGSHWDMRHRPGIQRKKSGKSRLQFVTTGDDVEDEFSMRETDNGHLLHGANASNASSTIGVFTHATPIKCLLTGLLDCGPAVSHKICIDDSSVTVLQHSHRTGWQIKRLNDTSHLRLL